MDGYDDDDDKKKKKTFHIPPNFVPCFNRGKVFQY